MTSLTEAIWVTFKEHVARHVIQFAQLITQQGPNYFSAQATILMEVLNQWPIQRRIYRVAILKYEVFMFSMDDNITACSQPQQYDSGETRNPAHGNNYIRHGSLYRFQLCVCTIGVYTEPSCLSIIRITQRIKNTGLAYHHLSLIWRRHVLLLLPLATAWTAEYA